MLSAGIAAFERNITGQHKGVCPGDRNVLLIRSVKSDFALLLAKVTKPIAKRRNNSQLERR